MAHRSGRASRRLPLAMSLFLASAWFAAAIPAAALAAAPTEVYFSEYIEGSSNNKALEIYNGTGAAMNLATGAYSVQVFFNGSATAGLTINLAGTVANGDVYVLAHGSAKIVRLVQPGVGGEQARGHVVQRFADPRQHHDCRLCRAGVVLHPLADFPAAHAGHHHVEQNQVELAVFGQGPGAFSVGCFRDVEPLLPQKACVQAQHCGLILGDEGTKRGIDGHGVA